MSDNPSYRTFFDGGQCPPYNFPAREPITSIGSYLIFIAVVSAGSNLDRLRLLVHRLSFRFSWRHPYFTGGAIENQAQNEKRWRDRLEF